MSVFPSHICSRSGQNAGGTAEEEMSPSCLFLFLPFFPKIQKFVQMAEPLWSGPGWQFPCPDSLPPPPLLVSTLSHALSGVPKGVEPCIPQAQTLTSLWLCSFHVQRILEDFLHAACSQLPFLLHTPGAALGSSSASLIQSHNIQGCIKPRVKGSPFSLTANKK